MTDNNLSYIPLHVRSCYSINDGLQNVGDIVKKAAKLGIPAIAVTDFNNMAGFVRFYNACYGAGIKPIMGADLSGKRRHKTRNILTDILLLPCLLWTDKASRTFTISYLMLGSTLQVLILLLLQLKLKILWKYSEGLIILNGFRGDLAQFVKEDNKKKLQDRLEHYQKYYG